MLSYCPNSNVIPPTRITRQNDKLQTDSKSAKNGTITPKVISPNGISSTTNHMNGHVVSDRHPVLGSGYRIVEPPKEISSRRPQMAPTPDPGKPKPKVRFSNRVCSVQTSYEDPLQSASLKTEGTKVKRVVPKLLRSQSTQTDTIFNSEQTIVLQRSPSAPLPETCSNPKDPILRSGKAYPSASRSARRRYSDSSSSDGGLVSDADSNFSVVSARNAADEHPVSAILIGDSGTGKTCLVARLAENVFVENYDVTVGIDFNIARFELPDGRPVRLQLWDTAGQEKYRAITCSYYRKAMGVVLVYDVTRRESLDNILEVWRAEVDKYAESDVVLMLVGNKMDLDDYRTITTRVGAKVAAQLGATFFEVSAKEDLNVQSAFQTFATDIVENVYSRRNPCLSTNAVHIDLSNHDRNDKKTKGACNC